MNKKILLSTILTTFFSCFNAMAAEPTETEFCDDSADPVTEIAGTIIEGADSVATLLDDLMVVETRKLVQSDGAKLTYNVTEDPEAGSSNILDILRKVPGVTVDAEDNVKVNGQSGFKILKNGREDAMFKGDIKTILKSLPASSIKKIEVISEPGAKYDAEGVGGILNIVTNNAMDLSGFMVQSALWANAYNIGADLRGTFKLNKVMLDAGITYNDGKLWSRKQSGRGISEYDLADGRYTMTNDQQTRPRWDYGQANINLSWEPDTLNLFTFSVNASLNTWHPVARSKRTYTGPDGIEIWSMKRRVDGIGEWWGGNAQASYQHNFGREDNSLVLSYLYSHGLTDFAQYNRLEEAEGSAPEEPFTYAPSETHDNSHIFQADYSNAFNRRHKLETGIKGSINHTLARNAEYRGTSIEEAGIIADSEVKLSRFRDIYAMYATYTGSFGKLGITTGARYEFTRMGIDYRIGDFSDFATRLHDLVPNAAVSYNFTPSASLRLAYQMRIGRPGIWAINPFADRLTPGEVTYGNPDLKSEMAHNISISYSNYGGEFGGMAKFTYRHVANSICDVIFVKDDLLNATYANIGRDDRYSIELNGDWAITQGLRWSLYGCASYVNIKAESEMLRQQKDGWNFDANTSINYTMPCKVRLTGYAGYSSPWIDLQSRGRSNYFYGIGASRSFLKDDALSVSLSLANPFPAKRHAGLTQKGEGFTTHYDNWNTQWNLGLRISYRFGGLKTSLKQTAASIGDDGESSAGKKH